MMDRIEVIKLLKVIEASYPGRASFDEDAIGVWCRMLGDIPYNVAGEAVRRLVSTNTFPPSIAEIRKAAWEVIDPLPSAEEAYQEARAVARNFTLYSNGALSIEWSHPLVKQAADTIGLETMAYSTNPEYIGRQFREVYDNLRDSAQSRRQHATPLPAPEREQIESDTRRLPSEVS